MSSFNDNIYEENLAITKAIDDSSSVNNASNPGCNDGSFKFSSCNARCFFTYQGLNLHLRTCLRKTIEGSATSHQQGPRPGLAKSPIWSDDIAEK